MTSKDILKEFDAICRNRPIQLEQEHAKGIVVVEYTGAFIPEELIYAAGAKPYPMWKGGEPDAPDARKTHAGLIWGATAGVVGIAALLWYLLFFRKKKKSEEEDDFDLE